MSKRHLIHRRHAFHIFNDVASGFIPAQRTGNINTRRPQSTQVLLSS